MRTTTIIQSAKKKLMVVEPQEQPKLSPKLLPVPVQSTIVRFASTEADRVLSALRPVNDEKEMRGHWPPASDSAFRTGSRMNALVHEAESCPARGHETTSTAGGSDPFEWRDAGVKPKEFDEGISKANAASVDTSGRISRAERAFQEAMELGLRHGWTTGGIDILASVFERNGWGLTKKVLDFELEAGMTPDELSMAAHLRAVWEDNPEYAAEFLIGGQHGDQSVSAAPWNSTLSWRAALNIVRDVDSVFDADEIEAVLCDCYDKWKGRHSLMESFRSFYSYLLHGLRLAQGSLDALRAWALDESSD